MYKSDNLAGNLATQPQPPRVLTWLLQRPLGFLSAVLPALLSVLRAADRATLLAVLEVLSLQEAAPAWCVGHADRGILASVVYDTQGVHLPARRVMREGTLVWERRKHIAYISNLVVAAGARRCALLPSVLLLLPYKCY